MTQPNSKYMAKNNNTLLEYTMCNSVVRLTMKMWLQKN